MIPLKISEVRKSLAEDLKFKSAPVKRAGWASLSLWLPFRDFMVQIMRETRRANARVWSSLTIFSLPFALRVAKRTKRERKRERERERVSDRNRRTVWQDVNASVVITRPMCVNPAKDRSKSRSWRISREKFNRSKLEGGTVWYSSMKGRFGLSERDRSRFQWSFIFLEDRSAFASNSSLFKAM